VGVPTSMSDRVYHPGNPILDLLLLRSLRKQSSESDSCGVAFKQVSHQRHRARLFDLVDDVVHGQNFPCKPAASAGERRQDVSCAAKGNSAKITAASVEFFLHLFQTRDEQTTGDIESRQNSSSVAGASAGLGRGLRSQVPLALQVQGRSVFRPQQCSRGRGRFHIPRRSANCAAEHDKNQ